jgi:hypothetical protein
MTEYDTAGYDMARYDMASYDMASYDMVTVYIEGFLLMFIYAMINMNIVSWGTREVPRAEDLERAAADRLNNESAWHSFIREVTIHTWLLTSLL